MVSITRRLVISFAAAATLVSSMPAAEAFERHGDRRRPHVTRHDDRVGAAIGAGIIGLALGAVIVGAISKGNADPNGGNPYRRPRPSPDRTFFPAAPHGYHADTRHAASFEPWSPGWYDYCAARYRSFSAAEGTFPTYGGKTRFCVAE